MPRTKIAKRTRKQLRQEAEREEQLRMAQMKLDSALEKIDELGKRSVQQVNNQLQLILARTHQHVLQMKWSEFLKLGLKHFEDYQWTAPPPPKLRSQSITRSGRQRTPQQTAQARGQVQSVDRGVGRRGEEPTMALLRWPRPGEVALSTGGSPLAVQSFPDRQCANVHIPTKLGVLKLQPQKLSEVKREVLRQLDATTLNQIKTLNSNLHMIVDMATQLRKT